MAYPVEVTISVGSFAGSNSQGIAVSLTYRLERADTDVLAVIVDKVAEVVQGHQLVQNGVREAGAQNRVEVAGASKPLEPQDSGEPCSAAQIGALQALLSRGGWSESEAQEEMKSRSEVASFEQLSARQATAWLLDLQRLEREKARQNATTATQLNGQPE